MLNLDHPITQSIFAASRAKDAVLMAARHMTVACRQERVRLRDNCTNAFAELRQLSQDHFSDYPEIPSAIEALERSLAELAALPTVTEEGLLAEYHCPACGAELYRCNKYGLPASDDPTAIYCSPCLDILMPALLVLTSCEVGFGTECI